MSVNVDEILIAARVSAAALTGETAGYLLLGAADRLSEASGRLVSSSVFLAEDGSLTIGPLGAGAAPELEADLRALLGRMLSHSRQGVPALLRVAQQTETRGVVRLVSEIEAALIPVNRSAARRALSRLHRDVTRAKAAGKLSAAPSAPAARPIAPAAPPVVAAPLPVVAAASPSGERAPAAPAGAASPAPFVTAAAPRPAPSVPVAAPVPAPPLRNIVAPVPLVASMAGPAKASSLAETAVPPAVALRKSAAPSRPEPAKEMAKPSPGADLVRALQLLADADLEPAPRHEPRRAGPIASVPERPISPSPLSGSNPAPSAPTSSVPDAPFVEAPPPSRVFGSRPPLPELDPKASAPEPTPVVQADVGPVNAVVAVGEPSPDVIEASVYEPEATPFLGSWPGLAPAVTALRSTPVAPAGDEDTDRLPPIAFDVSDVSDIADVVDVSDAVVADVADLSDVANVATVSDVSDVSDVADVADVANPSDVANLSDESGVANLSDESDVANPSDVANMFSDVAEMFALSDDCESDIGEAAVVVAAPEASSPPVSVIADAAVDPAPSELVAEEPVMAPLPELAPLVTAAPVAEEPAPESPAVPPPRRLNYQPRRSDVSELLAGFGVAESRSLRDISRELKRMADVSGTPCPPAVAMTSPAKTRAR